MKSNGGFFIEVDTAGISENMGAVSGDVFLHKRVDGRSVVVLADGDGSGIKANVIAGVIASMAVNYIFAGESLSRAARMIINTFVTENKDSAGGRHATFTILDIRRSGEIHAAEFGNPLYLLLRGGKEVELKRQRTAVNGAELYISRVSPEQEDRIVLCSDGITMSGHASKFLPEGWGKNGVVKLCLDEIKSDPTVSAGALCRRIVSEAESNDKYAARNDMTSGLIYFRRPRKIIVLTGPPYNEKKDHALADIVAGYGGTKMICGGTTAQIISRELGRELNVVLKRDPAGLPPVSAMEGIDLVTEGVLTLGKVKRLLENTTGTQIDKQGTDAVVARMLLEHDVIDFVVGTRINPRHQDPNMPVELELRRNLIKDLESILTNKFMKQVKVQYI